MGLEIFVKREQNHLRTNIYSYTQLCYFLPQQGLQNTKGCVKK